ncbi:golgin subfamily A member 4 isoform X4 [Meriones unguiculatus]|uniref:golgin subfamily A member 4 isoform X4 n=1 Tax=Meriones unguiculatus TaxID=10047 RepID=UPI000B4FAE84|nr:golgin subfamily A member 4 isoform X4 [Meriones unguiculatus]
MFKKLKQKISEEQQLLQQALAPAQVSSSSSTPTRTRSRTSSFTDQLDDVTPDREQLAGMVAEPAFLSEYTIFALDPSKQHKTQRDSVNAATQATKSPDGINRSESSSPQSGDAQTFAQKLQLRVPSVESLFRSPIKESLFRSSKESLVRTSSRESLNQLDLDCSAATFDPPSDMESEAEDTPGSADSLSREQLLQRLRRMERSLSSYRGKYSELVTAYQNLQREKKKLQGILSQSQDKSLRRISELREELQMDQQAKKHLQEEFDACLEEKDQYISVLQTQVSLLKQRLQNGPMSVDLPKPLPSGDLQAEVDTDKEKMEDVGEPVASVDDGAAVKTLEMLQQRVKRQENLLQRCKETIRSHKEQCTLLISEKEALQEQLDERLQELEKMKELHMAEKTKLITQLRDAKNLIEQLEQDKGMVITETKRQMHETLELKEEEIAQLRSHIKQMTTQREELREQKEKSERAAFEELEKALSTAQKTEEAQRKMKAEMDEQIKAVERASEEERLRLQQELSRVRQEAASMVKKTSEEQLAELRKLHAEELASKEQELTRKLEAQERELREQMKMALEKTQSEYLKLTQEKEQQESLALEELELQKKAILTGSENKLQELRQEAEAYRTRILELETSLEKSLQESKNQSEHSAVLLEAEKKKHSEELRALAEKHRTELEVLQQQQNSLCSERLQSLTQQQQAAVEQLREKYEQEKDALLKEKESLFQAHIQDMNEKTLEKLDVKQTELESLSSELSEALRARDQLADELSALRGDADKVKQALEAQLEEQRRHHQQEVDSLSEEQEITVRRTEKALKDEINQLGLLLTEKDEHLRERQARIDDLEARLQKSAGELQQAFDRLDLLHSQQSSEHKQASAREEQLAQMQQQVLSLETEKSLLTKQVAELETQEKHVCVELDTQRAQVQQLERQKSELEEKIRALAQLHESQLKDSNTEKEQVRQILLEKENIISQMREEQTREIEILKQKLSSKEESISILHEEYETKFKNQEKRMEKIKQKAKEMQETKKKLLDQEAKLKKELENTVLELGQKEKQFNAQILEMTQANSAGISDTVSRLEANQQQQIESLTRAHQRKLDDVVEFWEKRLSQQAEELRDKHKRQVEEKEQELAELKQTILTVQSEKEEEVSRLKEAGAKQDSALTGLQDQLEQKSASIASLSQNETQLKSQVEKLEVDLGCSLSEKVSLQKEIAELKMLAVKEELRVSELTGKMQAAEEELQSWKSLHESSKKSLEDKSLNLKTLLEELDSRCEKTKALLEAKTNELLSISRDKTDAIFSRLSHCQQHTATVREALLRKTRQVSELEAQLAQLTEEQQTLQSAFRQVTHQLEEKEDQIKTMKADIEGLVTEKEALQKEGGQQQQAASEKESCITQLKKELSENINAVTLLREELSEKKSEIDNLNKQLSDLSAQLENSVSLSDKAAAISLLSRQHEDQQLQLQGQLRELSSKVDTLNEEKMSALEQVDHWSNKFSEWKKKAQPRFAQYQSTIKDLQTQLDLKAKEASEKDEQIRLLKEDLDQQNKRLDCLKGEMEDRKNKIEKKECDLETELKIQTARVAELEDCVTQGKGEIESLNERLKTYSQQEDTEHRELVQKLQQCEKLGEEKDSKVREAEATVLRLEKQVSSLEAELEIMKKELEHVNSTVKSRDGELKALENKLELESAAKVELKRKAEQKIAVIKKQLLSQMEEKKQQYEKDTESQLSELNAKIQEREKQNHILEEKLKNLESFPRLETPVVSRSIEHVAVSLQQVAESQGCTQKACEERICELQRRLVENEKLLHRLGQGAGEAVASPSEIPHKDQDSVKSDHPRAKPLEDQLLIGCLHEELEEKKAKCSLVVSQPMEEETGKNNTGMKQNWASVVDNVQKTLQEKELTCQTLEQKVKELESDLVRERDAHRLEMEKLTLKCEKYQVSQQDVGGKNKPVEVLEDNTEENSKSRVIQPKLGSNMDSHHNDLESQLAGAELEKQKLSKEVARLQKDLRALRKEHQQELDILKKECEQEAEEKLKQEQEDLELKHTSTLKQLMREFNTQLAQKEQELERTVKETIDKAQEVEAELLESHQEETQQLHRKIAEKDDALKRTARRYEEILDAREEEMTAKVNDLQTQLEELQKKYEHKQEQEESTEDAVTIMELQTQLAQKTTLISDSKLKEQELREQVHNLEDRLRRYEKSVCAAPVGTPYRGGNLYHTEVSLFGEPTEFEYLRKVLFEYMMGRETKTMAKVITTVLKFPDDQAQKILEREDARLMFTSARSGIF